MAVTDKADQQVAINGRKKPLKDVEVPLRDRVLLKLVKKLEDLREGQRTVELWNGANARRQDWLERQQHFQTLVDEFLTPIHSKTASWQSNLHLPVTYTAVKTMHARFLAALFGIDPPFTVKARQSANIDRVPLVTDLMRYTLKEWANHNQGVEATADMWLWDILSDGSGTLKARWTRKYTRFVDVIEEQRVSQVFSTVNPETNALEQIPQYETVELEKEVTIPCFIGPQAERVSSEDIVFIGGEGDPQRADEVIEQAYLTAGELWTLVDQGIFRDEPVRELIEKGKNNKATEPANAIKVLRAETAGNADIDNNQETDRYHVLERYARIDVDGSGIPAEVILWVAKESGAILRATYLHRVSKTGKRPYFRAFFHRRRGDDNGVGLPELMYSLAMEIDAFHNLKIDFGVLSSMPFGYYRPTSSLSEEKMPVEPGTMVPLDNPATDVYFPNIGAKWSFAAQEEQFLFGQIERLTSISAMNLGAMDGTQGVTRTATGARALLGESNANLSVYLKRINLAWKQFLNYMFEMVQEKMPPGLEFRVFGDDGSEYFRQVKSREEIAGMYDFEISGNSEDSNRSIQIETANNIVATVMNPLLIQLGVVTPAEIFNALKNKFVVEGVKDWSKYLRKPQGAMRIYTPEEIANAVLAGVEIKLGPEQDLQGFIEFVDHIDSQDELLGQFREEQWVALNAKKQEAMAMLESVAAQQAKVANAQQVSSNAMLTTPSPQAVGTSMGQAAMSGGQAPMPQ